MWNRLVAGADLIFTLSGSPGGTASVKIVSVKGKLALDEVSAHFPPQHQQQLASLLRLIAVERGEGRFELQLK